MPKELFPVVSVSAPSESSCTLDLWDFEYSDICSSFGDVAHLVEVLVFLYTTQPDIRALALFFEREFGGEL